jgi:putative transposase
MNTALALRQAIWRKSDPAWAMCGLPDVLHVDHGSDFTSHHLEYTAVALKIRLVNSTVGRPQGRGKIERFFGTVNAELLTRLPGHLAPDHAHRNRISRSQTSIRRSAISSRHTTSAHTVRSA